MVSRYGEGYQNVNFKIFLMPRKRLLDFFLVTEKNIRMNFVLAVGLNHCVNKSLVLNFTKKATKPLFSNQGILVTKNF